jgi:hypothetical protein
LETGKLTWPDLPQDAEEVGFYSDGSDLHE